MEPKPALLDAAIVLAAVFLVLMMFSMGLALGRRPPESKQEKRHLRRLLLRSLSFELVLLPVVALALTWAVRASGDVAIALLLLAAAPGGRFAPQLSKVARAELAISVETTLFLAKLVGFTAPVTARLMLHTHHLELHELRLIASLVVLQIVPYVIGRQIGKRRPSWASRLDRPLEWAVWISLAAVLVVVAAGRELRGLSLIIGDRGWWAVLAFAVIAPALGWLLGGPSPAVRRSFAVSANARNLAVAMMLAGLAFADRSVQLACFAIWVLFTVVDCGFAVIAGGHLRLRRGAAQLAPR